jgi:hypothetical protein
MKLSEFISAANLEIFECTGAAEFHSAVKLMDRYRDTPMDFADATLVLLAEDIAVPDVLTLDRRGFRTNRRRMESRYLGLAQK